MIDMKITDEEKKDNAEVSVLKDSPSYPYGLCICLDSDGFKKLGIPIPQLGEKLKLEAMVEVTSLSKSMHLSDNSVNVSLQIKEMELNSVDGKSASEVIY